MNNQQMYDRTRALVPPETRELHVLVAGAGMVGSWVTAALTRMVESVTLVDYDKVEMVNVGVQQYTPEDIGKSKVVATAEHNFGLNITPFDGTLEEFVGTQEYAEAHYDVVVSAIDSMGGRRWLAEWSRDRDDVGLFVDVRIMGEMVCVLTATDIYDAYLKTVLLDSEVEEATCGAEGTVYSGMFAASRVAAVVNNWARGMTPNPKEVWAVSVMQQLDAEEGGERDSSQEVSVEEGFSVIEHQKHDFNNVEGCSWCKAQRQAYHEGLEAEQAEARRREEATLEADQREEVREEAIKHRLERQAQAEGA